MSEGRSGVEAEGVGCCGRRKVEGEEAEERGREGGGRRKGFLISSYFSQVRFFISITAGNKGYTEKYTVSGLDCSPTHPSDRRRFAALVSVSGAPIQESERGGRERGRERGERVGRMILGKERDGKMREKGKEDKEEGGGKEGRRDGVEGMG